MSADPTMRVATAQFEVRSGDKDHNLTVIQELCEKAADQGAQIICFPEMCISGYTFLKDLDEKRLDLLAEDLNHSQSVVFLQEVAGQLDLVILAGLLEKDGHHYYNTQLVVNRSGIMVRHRKLHPFISRYLSPGDSYTLFEINGWKCGVLTCYDNNIIENVRATTLLGAEIIFAPHVTMCTPSPFPGSGYVSEKLWANRINDPQSLRKEFDGPKGREWLLRWLPARAYDNGVYYVFSNPIGPEGDQIKNGNSLVLDPFGEVIAEVRSFENELTIAICTRDKLTLAGGYRYRNARKPELYDKILGKSHQSKVSPPWLKNQTIAKDSS